MAETRRPSITGVQTALYSAKDLYCMEMPQLVQYLQSVHAEKDYNVSDVPGLEELDIDAQSDLKDKLK